MLHLNTMTMAELSLATMDDLTQDVILTLPEAWSEGTVATQVDRNNWDGLSLTLAAGTNTTSSVIAL
jgi:hypothetical protein